MNWKSHLALLVVLVAALVPAAALRAETDRSEAVTQVESCEAILRSLQVTGDAIPASILRQAKGILITNQFKAGFIFAVKGGYGVVMVKRPNGDWSIPVIIHANEASLGLQAGAKSVTTVYVIMNEQTPRLLFNHRFDIGVDAKAVAGPKQAGAEQYQHPLIDAPVLVYSHSAGLYVGATVKATQITRDDEANFVLYHTGYELPELLYSDWVKPVPEVVPLMDYVKQITSQ